MQYINKDKLIKILQTAEWKDLNMEELESILNIYGDSYYLEGCNMELCKRGKEIEESEEEPKSKPNNEGKAFKATLIVDGKILGTVEKED